MFLLNQKIISSFVNIYDVISLFAAELGKPKLAYEVKDKYTQQKCNLKVTPFLNDTRK